MRPNEMTDMQLDAALRRLYDEHLIAGQQRRAVIHQVIEAVLAEQKTRRDAWLREGARV